MKTPLLAVLLSTLLLQACATTTEAAPDAPPQRMQEMHTRMATIKAEQDPDKREALMMQHMEAMQENMTMMHQGTAGDTSTMTMEERMSNMEQHMEMMQMMMGQMMHHHEGMAGKEGEEGGEGESGAHQHGE